MPKEPLPTWGQDRQEELDKLREKQSGFHQEELRDELPKREIGGGSDRGVAEIPTSPKNENEVDYRLDGEKK